jgi:histidinol-phosphatase
MAVPPRVPPSPADRLPGGGPDRWLDDLAVALEAADAADAHTLPIYEQRSFAVESKADHTWVTDADRGAEAAIRVVLAARRPDDAVLGEEQGLHGAPGARRRWIIDPVDGTSNFVKGLPVWATLIALEDAGELVVGVVSAPALRRRWWAARGAGAFADGQPIHVSETGSLARCHLAYSDVGSFYNDGGPAAGDALVTLAREAWRARGLGDFWMHVLVAEGAFDVAAEPIVNLWDLAALLVIVEEAGGRFTDLHGHRGAHHGSAISSNGILHDEVVARFRAGG